MAHVDFFFLGLLSLVVVSAAPSDIGTKDKRTSLDIADTETNSQIVDALSDANEHAEQAPRQKRWHNFHGFGVPPVNPIAYPHQFRDESVYAPDPFQQIHNRIRDLTAQISGLRPFTTYFPVLFIPQYINCGCSANPTPKPQEGNNTSPDIETRFPVMEDPRQNWGYVINNSVIDNTDYSSRPIDLDPYVPDVPLSRPPPPVEHGSSQAGLGAAGAPAAGPALAAAAPPLRPQLPTTQAPRVPPSTCDSAVITCCHRAESTYECFNQQGCPEAMSSQTPCEPEYIQGVIARIQMFYGLTG